MGFDKNIRITVPTEWQADIDIDFPLIIIFDSQNQRSHNYIVNTIDYLTAADQMPSAVIVSVASDPKHRYRETCHKASNENCLADENEAFLFEELIPLLEDRYRASSFRMLIGHSRYGYFTTSLLISRPEDLNAVISMSPFFDQKNVDLTDSITNLNDRPLEFNTYYRFGIGDDYPDDFGRMDSALHQLSNPMLNAKGHLFEAADHNATPGLTIGTALYEVFKEWALLQGKYLSTDQKDLTIITSIEEEIKKSYGTPIPLSIGTLNGKGWSFFSDENKEKAIDAWTLLVDRYPNFSEGYLYIIEAKGILGQDYSKSIERFDESIKSSEFYSEEEKTALMDELQMLIETFRK